MKKFIGIALVLGLSLMGIGCGSNSSSQNSNSQAGAVFVTGEDAPLSSVVGFSLTLNSITLNEQGGSTATVLSTPTTVDFARLLGLRSPLAFNSVTPGNYTSVTFVVANPMISYVDMTQNPPALNTYTGALPQNPDTITVNFPTPMVVASNGLAGLKMEVDIRKSVSADANGQILLNGNGQAIVTPVIYAKATKASDPDGEITDLMGGLVSVSAGNNSFVLLGPYGRQLTIYVNSNTQFNSGWNINNLATPAFVAVQGRFQADGSLMASGVELVTTSQSFVSGRVLQVGTNGSGHLQVTMWIGETGADMVSWVDTIQTIDINAVTQYDICFMDNPFTNALFDNTSIEVGQRIFIGGSFVNSVFTPAMISLRRQGMYGTLDVGHVTIANGNAGNFLLNNNGLVGYSVGGPVTVNTYNLTFFINLTGLSQLQSETTAIPLVTRGLLLKDQVSGTTQFYAGVVADPPQN